MIVAVIIGIAALICLSVTSVLNAVTFRRTLSDAFRALESTQNRDEKHLSQVLDRLMTIKWEDYAVVRSTTDDEAGGFILPGEEDEDDELRVDDGKWGHLSNLRERLRLTDNEQTLIDEDFDESGAARR